MIGLALTVSDCDPTKPGYSALNVYRDGTVYRTGQSGRSYGEAVYDRHGFTLALIYALNAYLRTWNDAAMVAKGNGFTLVGHVLTVTARGRGKGQSVRVEVTDDHRVIMVGAETIELSPTCAVPSAGSLSVDVLRALR